MGQEAIKNYFFWFLLKCLSFVGNYIKSLHIDLQSVFEKFPQTPRSLIHLLAKNIFLSCWTALYIFRLMYKTGDSLNKYEIKKLSFFFSISGTMLINLWLTISLYPNPVETENSKPKSCTDKCNTDMKQCANIANAESEQTLCYKSWCSCINKPLCKKERTQKDKSCLNECETVSFMCEATATTYKLAFECKKRKAKCQKTCWKYSHQNRYKD